MNNPKKADVIFENAKKYTEVFFQELDKIDQSSNHPVDRLDALLSLYKKKFTGPAKSVRHVGRRVKSIGRTIQRTSLKVFCTDREMAS